MVIIHKLFYLTIIYKHLILYQSAFCLLWKGGLTRNPPVNMPLCILIRHVVYLFMSLFNFSCDFKNAEKKTKITI